MCVFAGFSARQPNERPASENAHTDHETALSLSTESEKDAANHANNPDKDTPRRNAPFKWPEWMSNPSWWQFFAAVIGIGVIAWQSWLTRRAAQATEIAANAAKLSADIGYAVTIPTLRIEKFETETVVDIESASLESTLRQPDVRIVIKNHGQTPAFLRAWCLIFSCEPLPSTPVYKGTMCGLSLEKEVVKPADSFTMPEIGSWKKQSLSDEDVQAIIQRRKELRAYGYILYGDLFGNPVKRLKFCEVALNFWTGGIQWASEWKRDYAAYWGDAYLQRPVNKINQSKKN
jgi:hypothetical protein